ncbi:MAG: 30S ribosomal protein S3 [Patescibacteria group bacterium]|nr:30S ribosomal protein S3 [Patescibacteria group bacterium]
MSRRIKPNAYRLGISKPWDTRWITSKRNFAVWLEEDEKIRAAIFKKIGQAGIARIEIERTPDKYKVFIKASRPGLIIGRGGKGVEDLTKTLEKAIKSKVALNLSVEELKRTETSAAVVAQNIAWDLEKRFKFRRTIKKHLDSLKQNREVKGAKIAVSGRLDGNEIARAEALSTGKLPLSTLRSDIDYGEATAFTTAGTVGIKVWIYRGEIFENKRNK